jgi:acyl carrier protein
MKNKKKILSELQIIFEQKVKETDSINILKDFDSLIILQIINLAKIKYKKNINGLEISKCKTISEIIDIIF